MSGLMAVTGERDGPPQKVGVAVLDLLAGLELAVGMLATLLGRARRGDAGDGTSRVSVSLMESSVAALTNVLANHLASGREPERWGNEHPNIVPYQVFATGDGHVAVAVGNDAQFARLLGVLGLAPESRYASNAGRVATRGELIPWLGAAIAGRGRDELVAALRAADVPAGPVSSIGEALRGMEDAHDGAWLLDAGAMRLAPDPIRLDGEQLPLRLTPPTLGQQTDQVLAELGLSPAEIAQLRADNIIA
jgi:crotonobetainyl-CoA:carnitine CoA-transferase CaiB-like acyl-CoA transferase